MYKYDKAKKSSIGNIIKTANKTKTFSHKEVTKRKNRIKLLK